MQAYPAALLGRTKWGLEERLRCKSVGFSRRVFRAASPFLPAEPTLVRFIIVELRTS